MKKLLLSIALLGFFTACTTKPKQIKELTEKDPSIVFVATSVSSKNPSPNPKSELANASVCGSENYTNDPDYKEISEKEYVNNLPGGEEIYIQTDVQRCETVFDVGLEPVCAIQKTVQLVWARDKKMLDNVTFLESGCSELKDPSLRMEPWNLNDVRVKKDLVTVEHYWNYYSRSQKEEEEEEDCMLRIFRMDRKKMKLQELKERACRQSF